MVGIPVPDPPIGMVVAPASSTVAFWILPPPSSTSLAAPLHFLSQLTRLFFTLTRSPFKTKVKLQVQVFFPTFTLSPVKESARMAGTKRRKPNEISEVLMVEEPQVDLAWSSRNEGT